MNVGSYIFSQVVDYIPRYQFDKLVAKYHGNWHSKDLTCYNQLLHLLFGQITGCDSLRDICLCLEAHKPILYHLGFRNTVTQPSLSRANENRDYRIYEGLGTYLISIVRPLYSKTAIPEITVDNVLYALDSTTISTSIKLATWALGKYSKGGVKMLYFEYLYLTRFYRISIILHMYPYDTIFSIYKRIGKRTPFLVKRSHKGKGVTDIRYRYSHEGYTFMVERIELTEEKREAYGYCLKDGIRDDLSVRKFYPNNKGEIPNANANGWALIDVPGVDMEEIFPVHTADEVIKSGKHRGQLVTI